MFLARLALRNVFRNRRRSVLTLLAIACGIFTLILTKGLTDGYGRQSENNLIDLEYGHLQVYRAGYYEDRLAGLKDAIADPGEVLAAARSAAHVTAAVERLAAPSLIDFQGNELPGVAIGIDPEADGKVFRLTPMLVSGRGLVAGAEAMIGERLARTLGIEVGDALVWQSRALGSGESSPIQAVQMTVVGILSTGDPAIDGIFLFLPLAFMRSSLAAEGRATQVVVRLDDRDRVPEVAAALAAKLGPRGYEVKTWRELGKDFFELYNVKRTGNLIVIYIFLAIIAVGIVNTMLMATYERQQEIGMFLAMGMRRREIRWLFLLEGAFLGWWGSLAGIALASPLTYLLEVHGLPIAWISGGKDIDIGFPIRGAMYADLSAELVLTALAFGVILAMLASLWPAYRVSRLEPTAALRRV
jgi:putative ABC transport system permease protein